jgi:quercetin dioxygenase-like cupin family protein
MTDQKAVLDQMRNAEIVDTYVHTDDLDWIAFPGVEGIDMKVLRVSPETGAWTVLFQMVPESGFPRHKHLGAGEYFMLKGEIEVRGGVKNGGITAYAGDYGWEPSGMIHDWTNAVVDSLFLFTNHGALQFMDDDDNIIGVLDWQGILAIEAAARALEPA